MTYCRQRISRVIGYTSPILNRGTKQLLLTAGLAFLAAWVALGWADHSQSSILVWLFSPGLPIVLYMPFHLPASGLLDAVAKAAITAFLIAFVYYALLIYAAVGWIANHTS